MKKKAKNTTERDWLLVFVSSMLLLIGLAILSFSLAYLGVLGWWGVATALTGFAAVGSSVMAIVSNDPMWILLDLF